METLTGRLTTDAKVNTTKGGQQVVNFSIAINDRYKTKSGEAKEITRYVNCVYWKNTGIAAFLLKGSLVELAGRINLNVWNDSQGNARGALTLTVNDIKLHGKAVSTTKAEHKSANKPQTDTDDLPF